MSTDNDITNGVQAALENLDPELRLAKAKQEMSGRIRGEVSRKRSERESGITARSRQIRSIMSQGPKVGDSYTVADGTSHNITEVHHDHVLLENGVTIPTAGMNRLK